MAKNKIKHNLIVATVGLGAMLGVIGFGMRAKYKDNPKATIELAGEKMSLNKFYSHVSYDSKSDDFYYSDGSSSFYFSEIDDSLFQYKQHINKIKQKPLTVKHDTIYIKDTSSISNYYALMAVNRENIPTNKGLYICNDRTIIINHFIPYDTKTQQTAKKFFSQEDATKQFVETQERRHDYGFLNGITMPVGSPRELIENMYHDEFIGHLDQILKQYDYYIKTNDIDCFSLDFMKKAILSGKLRAAYPLKNSEKEVIAQGIINYVTTNANYKVSAVKNAVQNVKFGNVDTFKENKNHQRALLYKLYAIDVNGKLESFYPYFKDADLPITQDQVQQVENAVEQQVSKKSTLHQLREQQLQDKDAFTKYILSKNNNKKL